jgi:medium-chain acyl-[acyl-carrier-protein] hydrolase
MIGRWIENRDSDGEARLFCFAHAGGGGGFFRSWFKPLAPEIAVTPVILPGRETRWREPAFTRMDLLIEPLYEALIPCLDRPFALFGHSMGAVVAYELAHRLAEHPVRSAISLFVSARRMPYMPVRKKTYDLPDDQFLAAIRRLNGTAPALLRESALIQALLPNLRADFELNDTYLPTFRTPLSLPVSAFVGDRDQLVSRFDMRRWSEVTVGEFNLRVFDGDHFYLAGGPPSVLSAIRQDLQRALRPASFLGLRENLTPPATSR